jgi:hypothetical protein
MNKEIFLDKKQWVFFHIGRDGSRKAVIPAVVKGSFLFSDAMYVVLTDPASGNDITKTRIAPSSVTKHELVINGVPTYRTIYVGYIGEEQICVHADVNIPEDLWTDQQCAEVLKYRNVWDVRNEQAKIAQVVYEQRIKDEINAIVETGMNRKRVNALKRGYDSWMNIPINKKVRTEVIKAIWKKRDELLIRFKHLIN